MRDKDGMRVLEEVRKNKSTEKDESTSGNKQEVDVYHFTQVTNVALLLSPFFVAMALSPPEASEFVFKECHLQETSFFVVILLHLFYLYFSKFSLSAKQKKTFYFLCTVKGDIVCILHVFDGPLMKT